MYSIRFPKEQHAQSESGVRSFILHAFAWSDLVQGDPWRQHANTAEAEPWWLRDVHVFSSEPGWTADQNLHPLCFRSGGLYPFWILSSLTWVYLWFAPSQFLHPSLVRPQCPKRYRWLRTALWLWSARQWEALLLRSVGWRTDTLCSSVLVLAFSQLTLFWGQFWQRRS